VCSEENCENPIHAKGLCNAHYTEYRRLKPCFKCNKNSYRLGLCKSHLVELKKLQNDLYEEFIKEKGDLYD
jgi:hypothetical protein